MFLKISPFVILPVDIYLAAGQLANSPDPDQKAASDLGVQFVLIFRLIPYIFSSCKQNTCTIRDNTVFTLNIGAP